ncbi:lysine decarboxylase [Lactobacillus kalixensis DSM 16043]|uniref:Cytokinin riboside 5'-monophosphate phosphoribohydrolase n=2 Tax=Lactobacillus kalixensis TaxID=227944 RepID=A0A0R1UGQ3_9LACO|nr:lysine decarboxylase [Lactobacillus kalixensis DSM 16043]
MLKLNSLNDKEKIMIKKLAVYLGASSDAKPQYKKDAAQVGEWMVNNNLELVYGGSGVGLMKILSDTILDNGGKVHGVITSQLNNRGTTNTRLKNLDIVDTMDERKLEMMNDADGMMAIPGGIGTLEEISQAISWITLGNNAKPVAFYNYNNFYDGLHDQILHMHHEGFLEKRYVDAICFSDNLDEILNFMNSYQVPIRRNF